MVAALLRKPPPMKSKPAKAITSWLAGLLRLPPHLLDDLVGALERGAVGQDDGAM
jgi:hypothetical protein